jgi:hypothetical protein
MNRRMMLLSGAGVVGAVGVVYGGAIGAGAMKTCQAPQAHSLTSLDERSLGRIGQHYLHAADAGETGALRAKLYDLMRANGVEAPAALRAAAMQMASAAQADFEADDIVYCDGWALARSEARACALIALAAPTFASAAL